MRENFATVLETVADVRADRTVVTHGDRSLTWRQLDERASRLAAFLAGHGIGAQARVAIALYNGVEYLESVFAVLKLRAIPVNVNYRYQPEEMRHLFDDAQVAAVIFDASLGARVARAGAGTRALPTLVQVGDAPAAPVSSYEQVVGLPDPRWGQRVTAVVAPAGDREPTADALVAHVAARLAAYKKPRAVVFVPAVRRSPSGKADLRWARAVAEAAAGSGSAGAQHSGV